MGNCICVCKGEVDWPHEGKAGSVKRKDSYKASWEAVYASKQKTPDSVSIASENIKDVPFPEQVVTTEHDDNKSSVSVGTTSVLVPAEEEMQENIKQN